MAKKPLNKTTPATVALAAAGIAFHLHAYTHHDDTIAFGAEAAAELGVDPLRIFKTLVVDCGAHDLRVAIVPVATQLDLKAFATIVGAKRARMADQKAAERSSGYVVGGISPIGQKTPLPTYIDQSARTFDTILVSAGRRGLQVELAAADLARITQGSFFEIARP